MGTSLCALLSVVSIFGVGCSEDEFKAIAVGLGMALIIGWGIVVLMTHGSPWLLVFSVLGFVVAVGKIGCSTH